MVHRDTAILNAANKDAQLVLALRVFDQFGFDAETPHLFQVASGQLDLIESFRADLDDFVTGYLSG